jgi:hypothetical protein
MARLTIPDEQTFAEFTVVTSTSVFPISFSLFAKEDLTVLIDDVDLGQSGFTFSGTVLDGGGYDGGTVTLNTAVDDVTVRIERNVAPARTSNFAPANSTPVGSVDQALNRLTATQQDLDRAKVERPAARAGKFLAFDVDGNEVASSGTGADDGLRTDLAANAGASLLGFLQSGTGAAAESAQALLRRIGIYPQQFGAVGDGSTNDRAALAAADAVAVSLGRPLVITASHRVASALTITSPIVFEKGGKIVPSSGIDVRLIGDFSAGMYQIFDLSNGGEVVLPDLMGEVWAVWWGANNVRTDNEVPIQQAIDALEAGFADATNPNTYGGGAVRMQRIRCLVSGPIVLRDRVRLVGEVRDYSSLIANAATWDGSDHMVKCVNFEKRASVTAITKANPIVVTAAAHGFVNGEFVTPDDIGGMVELDDVFYEVVSATTNTFSLENGETGTPIDSSAFTTFTSGGTFTKYTSQFGVRLEDMTLDASGINAIEAVVDAQSWNEQCGMKHCLVSDFDVMGLRIRRGYGGSAVSVVEDCEFMGNNVALSRGVDAQVSEGFTSTFHDIVLSRVTVTGCVNSVIAADKIRLMIAHLHMEDAEQGLFLSGGARATGIGLKASRDTDALLGLDINWSGRIDNLSYVQGPAPRVLIDYRTGKSGYTPFDGEFLPGGITYPFSGLPLFGGYITGGASPPAQTTLQIASVSRTGTGVYRCTLTTGFSLANAANYYGRAWPVSATNTGVTCQVVPQTSAIFDIHCSDATGAAANLDLMAFEIFHKP